MKNRPYCPVLATLVYVMSKDKSSVLLIKRTKREDDIHFGKYNGLGGKLEPTEDIVSGAKREVLEEAGIVVEDISLRGTINWPGFGKDGQDWFGFVFRVDAYSGVPMTENPEGYLEWVELSRLGQINLWESDRSWLHYVFDGRPGHFHGVAPFVDGKMVSWNCQFLDGTANS